MSAFARTLKFMNLKDDSHTKVSGATIWKCRPIVGDKSTTVTVVELSDQPSREQLSQIIRDVGPKRDYAVARTRGEGDSFLRELKKFGFTNVATVRSILFNGILELLGARGAMELPRATIEPFLLDSRSQKTNLCTRAVGDWLREQPSRLAIIAGPAGFGKTTICQILVNRFINTPGLERLPLYISSRHWKNLLEKGAVTIQSVFNEAVATTYREAALGEEMIEHLISEGAILPIFDGLDEICADAYTEISVRDIVDQLDDMFADNPNAKAIFTTRNTFWGAARVDERLRFYELLVRPFDNALREKFLESWFKGDEGGKLKVRSLIGKIESIGSEDRGVRSDDVIRFSESPYILRLASLAAEEQYGHGQGTDSWADARDPLDAILGALAAREQQKNSIDASKQNRILYSTALTFGEEFSVDDFTDILHLYIDGNERLDGMLTHHVLTGEGNKRRFLFNGLGDYIRAKAVANWIFLNQNDIIGIEEYLGQIMSEEDTSVDIFGEISRYYGDIEVIEAAFGDKRVRSTFSGRKGQGLLFLFARALRKQKYVEHQEIEDLFIRTFLGGERELCGLEFKGQIGNLSFKSLKFHSCRFHNVVFRNCEFDDSSEFANCDFKGDFAIYSCDGFEDTILNSHSLSPQARAVFASRNVKGSDRRVTESDVHELMRYIFSQLQNFDLRYGDMSREGLLSRAQKKNSYIANFVVECLVRRGVLTISKGHQRHRDRLSVALPEDVIAFHRDGAVIRSIRAVVDDVIRKFR
jgi:hypothetical protein